MTGPAELDLPTLLRRLASAGSRPALSFYRGKTLEGRLSYAELASKVEQVAGGLYERFGVRAGDRVALLAPNRLMIPVLVLALMRLGAVVVPLNPASSPEDWTYVLRHSGAKGLSATRELSEQVEAPARPSFTLAIEDVGDLVGCAPAPSQSLNEELGVVLYTSGTTGAPKGVALRQRSLVWNGWMMAKNFALEGATQLAVLPLYHAHAFGFGLMTALSTGGHLVFTERLEPFTWAAVIRAESVTVTSVVPTLLPMLLAARVTREQVPTLRHILVSSAPLPVDVARDFETRARIPLIQGWGLSEYTNFACCMPAHATTEDHDRLLFGAEVPSIGPSLSGTEVQVVDASGKPVAEGERGELVIRGPCTMAGYFQDVEATSRAIDAEGWLRSGDEGFFRTDVSAAAPVFFVTGRLKEIIIRDAEKYSPLRLERRLVEAVPELSGRLVVLGFLHDVHGEEVGAYIETDAWDEMLQTRVASAIDAMPVAERPKVVLHGTEPIARTHTGKIQRRKMQPWFAAWVGHKGAMFIGPKGRA